MKYLSVCSGIEAATSAWHPLGWTPAAFCEIEAFPSAVLAHHYPTVPNYGDFTRLIDAAHPIRAAGVDLLVGGTPCQAFSVAGLRRGLADARGGLTLEFVRLAQALRPRWIVWENVPGVLSQDDGRAFGAFLGALGELGYGWAYRVLDAQWFGVAQRRRRVFVVACAGGRSERAAAVLFELEGVRRDPPTRGEAGQRPAPTLAARTRGGGGLGTDFDLDGGLVASGAGRDGGVAWGISSDAVDRTGEGDGSAAQRAGLGIVEEVAPAIRARPNNSVAHVAAAQTIAFNMLAGNRRDGTQDKAYISEADFALPLDCSGQNPDRWQGGTGVAQTIAHVDVVGTLSDGAHNGGGLNGQDAYTGRILPVAFDTTQITSPLNRSVPKSGDPCHPLAAGAHPPAVAFDARQNDVLLYGDKTGPLDTDGHSVGVRVTGDRTHALRAEGADAGEDGTGRGTPIVPITFGFDAGQSENPKATHQFSVECAPPLIKARPMSIAGAQMAVRRLTPRECERLQGFPDDYTRIPYKKKSADECPDGPRYKALGNSMAVPVMRWIGERIAKVEKV